MATFNEFRDWIERKLGAPVTRVNMEDKQFYDRIMEAVDIFQKHHIDGSYKEYYILTVTDTSVVTYTLPNKIYSVLYMLSSNDLQINPEYMQVVFSDLYRSNSLFRLSPTDWAVLQTRLSLIKDVFTKEIDFTFNPVQHKITIRDKIHQPISICMEVYSFDDITTSGAEYVTNLENILNQEWVRDYALELCREQWGQNLSKFKGVGLLGGISVDGSSMVDYARGRQKELKDDLIDKWGGVDPVYFG